MADKDIQCSWISCHKRRPRFSLWFLRSESNKVKRKCCLHRSGHRSCPCFRLFLELYLFDKDWNMLAPYREFMKRNENLCTTISPVRLEYTRDLALPLQKALNVLGSMVNDEEKRAIQRRMKKKMKHQNQVVHEDSEISTEQIVRQVLDRFSKRTVIAGRCSCLATPLNTAQH